MLVYMVFDQESGRWWRRTSGAIKCGWMNKQEDGSIWGREAYANAAMKSAGKKHPGSKPVKIAFSLELPKSDPTYQIIDGQIWRYDDDFDVWIMGNPKNGCGVDRSSKGWDYTIVINGDIVEVDGGYSNGPGAMKVAQDRFAELTNGEKYPVPELTNADTMLESTNTVGPH